MTNLNLLKNKVPITEIEQSAFCRTDELSVKPLEDRILIKQLDREEKTASGIYLPESATEKPMQGQVIAMGPGKLLDSGERATLAVKEGDVVVFGKYSGTEIEIKGVTHLIVRESELLGMIEG